MQVISGLGVPHLCVSLTLQVLKSMHLNYLKLFSSGSIYLNFTIIPYFLVIRRIFAYKRIFVNKRMLFC